MTTRVALVTGGSSGIGEATALALREAGLEVYAVARRVDRMAGLEAAGVHAFAMDVTDDASMVAGIDRIIRERGRIDVLINNAGYGSFGAVKDVPIDEARRQFEVNLFGLARLTQLVTPYMRSQKSGTIINISSVGGVIYEPFGAWYHATKFAVEGLSDSLRVELRPFGIHLVIVRPVGVVTEWNTISRDSLLEISKGGAYEKYAVRAVRALKAADNKLLSSSAEMIAKTIVKAATAKQPQQPLPRRPRLDPAPGYPAGAAGPSLRCHDGHGVHGQAVAPLVAMDDRSGRRRLIGRSGGGSHGIRGDDSGTWRASRCSSPWSSRSRSRSGRRTPRPASPSPTTALPTSSASTTTPCSGRPGPRFRTFECRTVIAGERSIPFAVLGHRRRRRQRLPGGVRAAEAGAGG